MTINRTINHRVLIPADYFAELQAHLLAPDAQTGQEMEEVALLFAHEVTTDRTHGLLVARWAPIPAEAFIVRRPDQFEIDSAYIVRAVKQARGRSESVLLAHSHPGDPFLPCFSLADDRGEQKLYPLLHARMPNRLHGAVVLSPGGVTARLVEPDGVSYAATVRIVGRQSQTFEPAHERAGARLQVSDPLRTRQELIWGSHGQGLLRRLTFGVIGAGGTGSLVAQQLIHLGVGHLIVVDPQILEPSNMARVVGACQEYINHTAKVEIVARVARLVDPSIEVTPITEDVCQSSVLPRLVDTDLLFLCTDSHYSRAAVSALGVQYCIPVIDMGFRIEMNATQERVASAVGEVRLVIPGGYCLSCAGVLDYERIRIEKASPEERAQFPGYFANLEVADPSVITVNSIIAAQAVAVGVDILLPVMLATSPLDSYRHNALKGLVSHDIKANVAACGICGQEGARCLGDDAGLPL
jgi:molybdopterin-synthase adenylyltransferase